MHPQKSQPQPNDYGYNWQTAPVQWNPDGLYGGIKEVRTGGRHFLYIIPVLDSLLVILAVFLPWFSINFFGVGLSTNGIGALSAPPGFVDNMQSLSQSLNGSATATASTPSSSQPYESWHGWVLIALALLILALCGLGVALKSKGFAVGALVAGFVCLGLGGLDFVRTFQLISDTSNQLSSSTSPGAAALLNIQVGFGLYLLVAASLGVIVGGILTLTLYGDSNPGLTRSD